MRSIGLCQPGLLHSKKTFYHKKDTFLFAGLFQQLFLTYIPHILSEEKGDILKKKLFCVMINDMECVTDRPKDGYFGKKTR